MNVLSCTLKGEAGGMFATLMPEVQDSQEKGHEIPGATPEWYHVKYNDRGNDIYISFIYSQYLQMKEKKPKVLSEKS